MGKYTDELKENIRLALEGCEESGIYPNVCKMKSNPNGYARIEEYVISLIRNEGFGIKSAIAQVESTFEN